MSRLLIVSNRLPVNVAKKERGIRFESSVGGVATGLDSFYKSQESMWIGWSGITLDKVRVDEVQEIGERLKEGNCHPIFLSRQDADKYYYGFCNKTIWPLFHHFPLYTSYRKSFWEAYKRVSQSFCDAVVKIAQPDDVIWVHDYQLMLLPGLLRR